MFLAFLLIDTIFETGSYGVPSKSQKPTILGHGVQVVLNGYNLAGFPVGALCSATIATLC